MIRCREIATADLGAVSDFLTHGFPERSRNYWMDGLQRQSERQAPAGLPLDHEGAPFGVLLLIYTASDHGGEVSIRCNISIAQRHEHVTYLNIGPQRPRFADLSDTELVIYGP